MLILSRKLGETILVGNNVTLTVVSIGRGKVRLGVDAPRSVPVMRSELLGRPAPHLEDGPRENGR